jgi:hypothetical protein
MTHDDLVKRAVSWLKKPAGNNQWRKRGCGVVVPELVSYAPENPDAIGWISGGYSYLVECKCSLSDFLADLRKPHRASGAGAQRLFLCEPGVVPPEKLPAGWGLLHCHPACITIEAPPAHNAERNLASEMSMMYSLLRRAEVRGELRKCFAPKWSGDIQRERTASPTTATTNACHAD